MAVQDIGLQTLAEALRDQGFCPTEEFGLFITYERANDSLKIHVGPDGSFAAFDSYDELVAEGRGMQDLFAIIVSKSATGGAAVSTRRRSPRNPKAA